jgi:3-hydroxyisobutyrate dehydrogenase
MTVQGTALIGLGAMGLGMARSILGAGIALRGFDLSATALDALAAAGGTPGRDVRDTIAGCDLVIVMVVNAAQARAVLFDDAATDALPKGATVMLCSTMAPSDARAIADRLADAGHLTLDAPVSGGQVGAEAGKLTVMASGPPAAFDRAAAVLDAIAGPVHRLGDAPGLGATYKVVHQLAASVHLVAAAELLALGSKAGCDPEKLLEIVSGAAGSSWMLQNRGPRMLTEDPTCASSVNIFIKDLGLVLQTGREAGVPLPLASAAHLMFTGAAAMGHGADDDSMVRRAYEVMMGAPIVARPGDAPPEDAE